MLEREFRALGGALIALLALLSLGGPALGELYPTVFDVELVVVLPLELEHVLHLLQAFFEALAVEIVARARADHLGDVVVHALEHHIPGRLQNLPADFALEAI